MINYSEAKSKAENWIRNQLWGDLDKIVVMEETIEKEFGWVFFYQSKEYLRTGNPITMLLGNAPLIINRKSGEVIVTGTAQEIEYYIDRYEEQLTGKTKGYRLELRGERSSYHQVELMSKIKKIYACTTPEALKIMASLPFIIEGDLHLVQAWEKKFQDEHLDTNINKASA